MIRALRHAPRRRDDAGDPGAGGASIPYAICERPEPALAGDDVLVAVEAAVIGAPERWALDHAARSEHTPGGAAVGRVVRTGPAAAHLNGRRVLVGPEQACGECDVCRRGGVWACPAGAGASAILGRTADGALASHVVCRGRWACPIDDDGDGDGGSDGKSSGGKSSGGGLNVPGPHAALLAREAAWAYAMYVRAGVAPGQPVVVVGAGAVARLLVAIAAAHGTRPVVVAPPRPAGDSGDAGDALAWVAERGGVACAAPADPAASAESTESTDLAALAARTRRAVDDALRGLGHGDAPRLVFETEADPAGRALALALAGPCAQVTLLARTAVGDPDEAWRPGPGPSSDPGARPDPAADAAARLAADAASLAADAIGAVLAGGGAIASVPGAHPDLLPELAALAASGELDLTGLADVVPPDAIAQALARPRAAGDCDLVIVDFTLPESAATGAGSV